MPLLSAKFEPMRTEAFLPNPVLTLPEGSAIAGRGDGCADTVLVVVVVLVEVVAGIDLDALEMRVEDEVHDARDRVRPVHR